LRRVYFSVPLGSPSLKPWIVGLRVADNALFPPNYDVVPSQRLCIAFPFPFSTFSGLSALSLLSLYAKFPRLPPSPAEQRGTDLLASLRSGARFPWTPATFFPAPRCRGIFIRCSPIRDFPSQFLGNFFHSSFFHTH